MSASVVRAQSPEHVAARVAARLANGTYAVSDSTRAKIREARAHQVIVHSPETREKISVALMGNRNGNVAPPIMRGEGSPSFKHGMRHSTTYNSWRAMLARCTYPSNNRYPLYGGRGIKVCAEWMLFENFLSDMGERPEGMTLDRIDPNGHYEASNCRWATAVEQRRNRRDATTNRIAKGNITMPEDSWGSSNG